MCLNELKYSPSLHVYFLSKACRGMMSLDSARRSVCVCESFHMGLEDDKTLLLD